MTKRNPHAKALARPQYRQRVRPSRKPDIELAEFIEERRRRYHRNDCKPLTASENRSPMWGLSDDD